MVVSSLVCWIAFAGSTPFGHTTEHSPTKLHSDALGVGDHRQPLLEALVTRVEVVAAGERRRRRAEELVVEAVDWAGRVAQHAVDALAELAESIDLLVRLPVLAGAQRQLLLADDPRLDRLQLVHEVAHVDHEVANDREVVERLDGHRSGPVVAQEDVARELGYAVDHHPAASADAHAARPAVAQAAVDVRLDEVERVEHDHAVVRKRDLVGLQARLLIPVRVETRGADGDLLLGQPFSSSWPEAGNE